MVMTAHICLSTIRIKMMNLFSLRYLSNIDPEVINKLTILLLKQKILVKLEVSIKVAYFELVEIEITMELNVFKLI